jgi:hypothetical protein
VGSRRRRWHAHRDLDTAVAAAYGWRAGLTDEQVLERLRAVAVPARKRFGRARALDSSASLVGYDSGGVLPIYNVG